MSTKIIDKEFCMSSYLTFRYIEDRNILFKEGLLHKDYRDIPHDTTNIVACARWKDIDNEISNTFDKLKDKKLGILLSGGMDSATLAAYMPKGSKAYTFQTKLEGVIDETELARKYADKYGLDHHIVDISWEDMNKYTPICMAQKGAPVHSIEPQLYKAALQAQKDGVEILIIGESADLIFGGMDKLLSKDWRYDEWIERYTFVEPSRVLQKTVSMEYLFERYKIEGDNSETDKVEGDNIEADRLDFLRFMDDIFSIESSSSYQNAFDTVGIAYIDPFANLVMSEPLDLHRVRNGESKYLVRELFANKYPEFAIPEKIPMPRAVNQWLADWEGPKREEFLPNCVKDMNGDQKWLVYCLEMFLNINFK